jgi:hypothetical protein
MLANNDKHLARGRVMAGGQPAQPFTCPLCGAFYQVVKVEAGLETTDRELACRSCGAPLASREGISCLSTSF